MPLVLVKPPQADINGHQVEIFTSTFTGTFTGTDDEAKTLITEISPNYKPWFSSIMKPASSEIASLLFALQAALGAGFIGYFFGVARTKKNLRKKMGSQNVVN
ncbi:MAG: energy-coupling factor ABC transporter substrate-binding protein [Oligoflexia bacterium]|nr:energy-coupling factor ABC transporter substrate-binding protein [Oligoflexia bacterium]